LTAREGSAGRVRFAIAGEIGPHAASLDRPDFVFNQTVKRKTVAADQLSLTFAALADPTRRAMLSLLSVREMAVTELAAPFDISLPAISKHLKVLARAGLIERTREAQVRPCQLKAEPLKAAADWVDAYRQHWEASFDRLDDYLKELQSKRTERDRKK
jgi:DNA-binding transcriptional ArsR family regulator